MDKLAVGPGYPEDVIDLDKSATENVEAVAEAKGVEPGEIIVCVLDRPRHAELIAELRGIGCGVVLIGDGDVAGVIATTDQDTTIDMYMGQAARPKACWRPPRCAASAGSSTAGCCSATTTSASAPPSGASRISTGSTSWRTSPRATASSPPPASPTDRCSTA